MPAVPAGKVLVTGANGYLGLWVVAALLHQNYTVRSAVRTAEKAAEMQKLFGSYGDKHEIAIVPDITKTGAFDESAKGVDGIVHLASPFHLTAKTRAEMIEPAVGGARSILQSALNHSATIKRVVVASSTASISLSTPGPHAVTEADWTDAVRMCEEQGDAAGPVAFYRASKALAEQAAWQFVKDHRPSWDLVVTNPPWVFGPLYPGSPTVLNSSMSDWVNYVVKQTKDANFLEHQGAAWIDVRDNATAHVLALQKEAAANQRILLVYGHYKWQDWVISARKFDPEIPKGAESYDPRKAVYQMTFHSEKITRILGMEKFIDMDTTTKDILADFKARGII